MLKQLKANKQTSISTTPPPLNKENYYSKDNDWYYRSKSVFWQFMQCEAAALAQMKDEYDPFNDKTPLLFGNYVHSFFESKQAHFNFLKQNSSDLFKYGNVKKGLKKVYVQAQKCIKTLQNDDNFRNLYQGRKEVIVSGKLFGVNWKGKIDCLDLENHYFYDLKTVDDIRKKHWVNGRPASFAIERGYDMQMAIYQELIKQTFGVDCNPLIIAVSKQDVPDKAVFQVPQILMDERMEEIEMRQPHIQAVINGEEKPKSCGHCDYCRAHKKLDLNHIPSITDIKFD